MAIRPAIRISLAALVTVFFSAACAAAELQFRDVEVGLSGEYQLGRWVPVTFTLQADQKPWEGDVRVSVRDSDDLWSTYTGGPLAGVEMASGNSETITALVRIGRQKSSLRITATPSGETGGATVEVPLYPAVLATQQRVLIVGSEIGLRDALRHISRPDGEELIGSQLENVSELPSHWLGYDSVDMLVLTSSQTELYRELADSQAAALLHWVRMGGRVVLTVGAQGEAFLASTSFAAPLAPGRFVRTLPLRETTSIETFAEAKQRLSEDEDGLPRPPPLYSQLGDVEGEVLLWGRSDQPIVVRSAYGLGQVVYIGLDLETDPIADWPGQSRLLAKVMEITLSETPAVATGRNSGETAHLGFTDLAGQLRAALEVFDDVTLVNFSWVAALVVGYILVIGPVDYWLVSYVFRRRELTWLTSGAIIAGMCVLTWWLAGSARGDSLRVNQIDIVDIDVRTSQLRGTSWVHLYSPANALLDASLQQQPAIELQKDNTGTLLTWQGIPGESLGGMNRDSRIDNGGSEYLLERSDRLSAAIEIEKLPIAAGGSRQLAARWWSQVQELPASNLKVVDRKPLQGEFENPLDVRLTNCLLFHDRWVFRLGDLEPGQRIHLSDVAAPQNSAWVLSERTLDSRQQSGRWDQAMRGDVPKIARMMMFHELAGGRSHTELLNRYYGYLDTSHMLHADRAVLLGAAEQPAARLNLGGEDRSTESDRHWTFYRIVYPTK